MARPYSKDLRDRVVGSVAGGRSCRATAAIFGVSVASVVKWSQRWRATGSAAAKQMGAGGNCATEERAGVAIGADRRETGSTLRAVVAEAGDAHRRATARYGAFSSTKGSRSKKSLHASEQDRPDVARRRRQWKKYQGRLDPRRLVFIDETWAKTNMTRRCGRSRGTRLVAKVPHRRWRTLTFLAALRCDRIEAPCVIDGPINGISFGLTSSSSSSPPLAPETSSSWTIWAATKAKPFAN